MIKALSLSKTLVEFSLWAVYAAMVGENFQVYRAEITDKCYPESKRC